MKFEGKDMLQFVLEAEPGLQIEEGLCKGHTSTTVYKGILDTRTVAVRISRISPMENDLEGHRDLQGIEGIPELIRDYRIIEEPNDERVIALLVEWIEGPSCEEYFAQASPEEILKFLKRMQILIREIHRKGHLMPGDWLKEGNIIVRNNQPYLIDLGFHRTQNPKKHIASYDREGDRSELIYFIKKYLLLQKLRAITRMRVHASLTRFMYFG